MAKMTDKALQSAVAKDRWISDDPLKGHGQLVARLTTAGRVYFYFRYTHDSKQARYRLGSYDPKGQGGLTLKQARVAASDCRKMYLDGITDIKGHFEREAKLNEARMVAEEARLEVERKEAAARLSVNDLFLKWQAQRLSKYKDGGAHITRIFEKDVLPVIGELPAEIVRKGNIIEVTDILEQRGVNRTAKVAFASMRQMFQFGIERDFIEVDPTAGLKKSNIGGKDVERDRVLSEEEIRTLAKQMPESGLTPTANAAIWICLSTCCRIGELMKAQWEHVDFEKRLWRVPPENSKNGNQLEIQLSEFALKQFEIIHSLNYETPWLYPNRTKDDHVCTKTITKQVGDRQRFKPMKNRSQNTGTLALFGGKWTMHDLRRTGATLMSMLGIAPVVIEHCLNHTEQNKVQRIYQRYSYAPEMKEAWDILGERLESLTSGKNTGKVISINRKGGEIDG